MVVLYNTKLQITGRFEHLNFEKMGVPKADYLMDEAFISLGIADLKGVKNKISLTLDGVSSVFDPGIVTKDVFPIGVSTPVKVNLEKMDFAVSLDLNGSSGLYFLPFGKETNVSLTSSWVNPSFEGSFLPDKRSVGANGFSADWKVLHLNRNYPQQGLGGFIGLSDNTFKHGNDVGVDTRLAYNLTDGTVKSNADFGVRLMLPVDEYQKTNRSVKYAEMFIMLTFIAFFFIEILNGKHLHPLQYFLIGFAVCMFYLLLLSLSEHISFNWAYGIGCVAITGMITLYSRAVLKNGFLTGLVGVILSGLYLFFYTLLQLEDYALLLGSLGMLLILGIVMYLTRNIDWYRVRQE